MQLVRKKTWLLPRSPVIFGFILLPVFVACGKSEVMVNRPIAAGGGSSAIRTQVLDAGNGLFTVTAQPAKNVVGGSFVYCLGTLSQCQNNVSYQGKLVLADGQMPASGTPTRETHKIPQTIDSRLTPVISVGATDSQAQKPIWVQVKLGALSSSNSPNDQQTVIPPTLPSVVPPVTPPPVPPAPVNTAIDHFTYDRSSIERASQKISGVDFDYVYGAANLTPTAPKIRAKISDQTITGLSRNLGVVLGGYSLNDSATYVVSSTAISFDQQGALTVVGENLKPATIYKMRMHFFDRSGGSQSQARYVGSSSRTYNFATDGVGDALTRIRARIVMRGLTEENDWALNRYDKSTDYTHGAGGWCHIFYNWVITPYLKTRSGSENTHYSQSYWSGLGAVTTGAALATTSQREPIMGDYFRVDSHAAMILAYDVAKSQFVTLEGNFNNSVHLYQRSASGLSWVGHINQQMLRDTALQQLP